MLFIDFSFNCSLGAAEVWFVAPFEVAFLRIEDVVPDDVVSIFVKTMSAAPSPRPPIAAASATTVGVDRGGGGGG